MTELEIIQKKDLLVEKKDELTKLIKQQDSSIQTVTIPILNAKSAYVRKKTKSRSNELAKDMNKRFAILNQFSCLEDLQDYYGCGSISRSEYDKLLDLWNLREELQIEKGQEIYEDDVTKLFDTALSSILTTKNSLEQQLLEIDTELRKLDEEKPTNRSQTRFSNER